MSECFLNKKWWFLGVVVVVILLIVLYLFSGPKWSAESEQFVVPRNASDAEIIQKLEDDGFIRSTLAFNVAFTIDGLYGKIKPGGYKISKSMNAWKIARIIGGVPYLKWIVIPEGVRREEIMEILRSNDFLDSEYAIQYEVGEGTYFPNTYLIPISETWTQIAERMKNKFNEKFAPYQTAFTKQNIKWYTALKIASLVQREAAGKEDMPLIAGILWNRLNKNMRLQLDATVQYAKGKTKDGWWTPIKSGDTSIDSPYNTYRVNGLPPTPISNPGLDAIDAVLHPVETDCLYYIHDIAHNIYCSPTFEGHKENIREYL
ncbi:MAG: endolytic transglycosylase MltG [Candidatus Jorgensenbacteria bacterium]|nr:endolytic transglycosylase MltG [Candidatus Jorgensenbacteria bacterium]